MINFVLRLLFAAIVLICVYILGMLSSQGLFRFFSGGTSVNVTAVLESIQSLSQLTTTRYTYSIIVTTERDMPPLLAALYNDRMVMMATGHVNAGIDLGQITQDDIQQRGDVITVRLPAPTLQDCFFNEQTSYVISRDTGLFARPLPDLDTESRRYAVQVFRQLSVEEGILEEAQVQSETVIREFIEAMPGIEAVEVESEAVDSNAPLPATCR